MTTQQTSDFLTRNNASQGLECKIILAWQVGGNPSDLFKVSKVELYDEDPIRNNFASAPAATLPEEDIYHPATGVYETLIPAGVLSKGAQYYYDVWYFQESDSSVEEKDVGNIWVKGNSLTKTTYSSEMIDDLQMYLHDNDPTRDYHFSPPSAPEVQFNKESKKRHVWSRAQLDLCLKLGLATINNMPPFTQFGNSYAKKYLYSFWLQSGAVHAFRMKMSLWASEDFDYSVGSLSLSINKFDKYQTMLQGLEDRLMDPEHGIPDVKRHLTIATKGILLYSNNYFLARGGGRYNRATAFPGTSNMHSVFL